jgi:hypothetical protein
VLHPALSRTGNLAVKSTHGLTAGFFCLFFAASTAVNLMSFLRRIHIGGKRAASQMLTVKNPSYSGQATLKG